MANKYIQASDSIKTIANRFKGIIELATALEEIGSVDQAAKEANADLEKARKERDAFVAKFDAEMTAAKGELALSQAAADKVLSDAKKEAAELKQKTLAAAEKKAASIVESAQSTSDRIMSELAASKAAGLAEIAKINATISSDSIALDELKKAKAEAQAQYDKLDKALSALKAKFA